MLPPALEIVASSGYLTLSEYVTIHWITRHKLEWLDYTLQTPVETDVHTRFSRWRRLLEPRVFSRTEFLFSSSMRDSNTRSSDTVSGTVSNTSTTSDIAEWIPPVPPTTTVAPVSPTPNSTTSTPTAAGAKAAAAGAAAAAAMVAAGLLGSGSGSGTFSPTATLPTPIPAIPSPTPQKHNRSQRLKPEILAEMGEQAIKYTREELIERFNTSLSLAFEAAEEEANAANLLQREQYASARNTETTSDGSEEGYLSDSLDEFFTILDRETLLPKEVGRTLKGTAGEIYRDAIRTYQPSPLFLEGAVAYRILMRVLLAVAYSNYEIGYCQGMNFVAGALILSRIKQYEEAQKIVNTKILDDLTEQYSDCETELGVRAARMRATIRVVPVEEEDRMVVDIYDFMLALIDRRGKFGMWGLWGRRIPQLKLRIYQLDRLIGWHLPHLHRHLKEIDLSPSVLTAQWFITLFAYHFTLESTLRLWDYFFYAGWAGVFRIAVALLGLLETQLLALDDMEEVSVLMREWKRSGGGNSFPVEIEAIMSHARSIRLDDVVIMRLQEAFAYEIMSLAVHRAVEMNLLDENLCVKKDAVVAFTKNGECSMTPLTGAQIDEATSANVSEGRVPIISQEALVAQTRRIGPDGPTYWLLQHGNKMPVSMVLELLRVTETTHHLEAQVDASKSSLQARIVRVCEFLRRAQEELDNAIIECDESEEHLQITERTFNKSVGDVHLIAATANRLLQRIEALPAKEKQRKLSRFPSLTRVGPVRNLFYQWRVGALQTVFETMCKALEGVGQHFDESLFASTSPPSLPLTEEESNAVTDDPFPIADEELDVTSSSTSAPNSPQSTTVSSPNRSLNGLIEPRAIHNLSTFVGLSGVEQNDPESLNDRDLVWSVKSYVVLRDLELASQKAHTRLNEAHQSRDRARRALEAKQTIYYERRAAEAELENSRKQLCDELHLLVEDSNRGRSQKLLFITENFIF